MIALLLALAAADPAAPAPPSIDDGAVVEAVEAVLDHGKNAARVAVPPVVDSDDARRKAVEIAIVRAILDRRREEPITPAFLRAKLQANEATPENLKPFACDHVLFATIADEGGRAMLHLKLVLTETGEVLDDEPADLGEGKKTTAGAANVRMATDDVADQIAFAVESKGLDVHEHRLAVAPLKAEGAAKEARLDQFAQSELIRALKRRGFLVVERAQLAAALDQLALAQNFDDASAPKLGQMLGAQSLVVGSVADAGTNFVVTARVLSAEDGNVLGGATASLPRADVVTRAQVETRTPFEAAVRSSIVPGWGQAFNDQDVKAFAVGATAFTALATTGTLGIIGLVEQAHYNDIGYFEKLPSAAVASQQAVDTRNAYTGLYVGTAIAGGVFVTVWGVGIVDAFLSAPQQ
jgi:TolB-like protein